MLTRDPRKNPRIHGSRDPHPLKPIPMATGTVFWWVRVQVSKIYPWVTPVTHYRCEIVCDVGGGSEGVRIAIETT
jgi:hypothetical protein